MVYTPIIGTLGYVLSPDRRQTLLVYRDARPHDTHLHKYNGLGGKLKPEENVLACMKREIYEEAGITCDDIVLRGTINWTGFGPAGEDWLGFIFRIEQFSGLPFTRNQEGELSWHDVDRLHLLPMWEGDRFFLPMVFDDDPRIFHGCMPYKDGKPTNWSFARI